MCRNKQNQPLKVSIGNMLYVNFFSMLLIQIIVSQFIVPYKLQELFIFYLMKDAVMQLDLLFKINLNT